MGWRAVLWHPMSECHKERLTRDPRGVRVWRGVLVDRGVLRTTAAAASATSDSTAPEPCRTEAISAPELCLESDPRDTDPGLREAASAPNPCREAASGPDPGACGAPPWPWPPSPAAAAAAASAFHFAEFSLLKGGACRVMGGSSMVRPTRFCSSKSTSWYVTTCSSSSSSR